MGPGRRLRGRPAGIAHRRCVIRPSTAASRLVVRSTNCSTSVTNWPQADRSATGHATAWARSALAAIDAAASRGRKSTIVVRMGPDRSTERATLHSVHSGPRLYRPASPLADYIEFIGDRRSLEVDYCSRALPRGAVTVVFDVGQRQQLNFCAADGNTRLSVPPTWPGPVTDGNAGRTPRFGPMCPERRAATSWRRRKPSLRPWWTWRRAPRSRRAVGGSTTSPRSSRTEQHRSRSARGCSLAGA
jgi:hypothetical protein